MGARSTGAGRARSAGVRSPRTLPRRTSTRLLMSYLALVTGLLTRRVKTDPFWLSYGLNPEAPNEAYGAALTRGAERARTQGDPYSLGEGEEAQQIVWRNDTRTRPV